jgi:hypothetical protein
MDRQLMEIVAQQMNLGATGRRPMPPVSHDDEGEIQMGISHDAEKRKVYLNFGKTITWVGLTPEQAMNIGEALLAASRECRGIPEG